MRRASTSPACRTAPCSVIGWVASCPARLRRSLRSSARYSATSRRRRRPSPHLSSSVRTTGSFLRRATPSVAGRARQRLRGPPRCGAGDRPGGLLGQTQRLRRARARRDACVFEDRVDVVPERGACHLPQRERQRSRMARRSAGPGGCGGADAGVRCHRGDVGLLQAASPDRRSAIRSGQCELDRRDFAVEARRSPVVDVVQAGTAAARSRTSVTSGVRP